MNKLSSFTKNSRRGVFMVNFYTDLADERREIYRKANQLDTEISGVDTEEEQINENIKTYRVKITNEEGAKAIQKPIGNYITIDVKNLKIAEDEEIQQAAEVVTRELKALFDKHIDKQSDILVVGLGNESVTPDSLGPKVVSQMDITRHLLKYAPQYLEPNARPVSAIAPGVLGTTGIETAEVIKGVVDNVKPKLIIVIDSLASKSTERISSTIQIADTGIVPGAGVGNTRTEISENTFGIPVIAIGVPMVVDLRTIMNEGIDAFVTELQNKAQSNAYINNLKESGEYLKETNEEQFNNMIVTPKEIDDLINNMRDVISRGINFAF